MDSHSFDQLTRTLATGSTRRSVLRGLLSAALATVAGSRVADAQVADQVSICHRTSSPNKPWEYKVIDAPALESHLGHGDVVTDLTDVNNCGACGNVCTTAVANATAFCGETGCDYACNQGYEDDGAGGCAEVLNPAINVSFDPSADPSFCLIQVDLVDFADNTEYPVTVEISSVSSSGPVTSTWNGSLTTDDDGFASGYPIGAFRQTNRWARAVVNGITTAWHDIAC